MYEVNSWFRLLGCTALLKVCVILWRERERERKEIFNCFHLMNHCLNFIMFVLDEKIVETKRNEW